MGQKGGGEKEDIKRRAKPVTVSSLLVADRQNPVPRKLGLSTREVKAYNDCLEAYKRAVERPLNTPEVKSMAVARVEKFYETTHKVRTSKGGKEYWEVTTAVAGLISSGYYIDEFYADGTVVARSTYRPTENVAKAKDGKSHTAEEVQVSFSTILWCQYSYLLTNRTGKFSMTIFEPSDVSNDVTNDVAHACLQATANLTELPDGWIFTWHANRPEEAECLNALLGTPNGLAGLHLLRDWGSELGLKEISSIMIDKPAGVNSRQVNMSIMFDRIYDDIVDEDVV